MVHGTQRVQSVGNRSVFCGGGNMSPSCTGSLPHTAKRSALMLTRCGRSYPDSSVSALFFHDGHRLLHTVLIVSVRFRLLYALSLLLNLQDETPDRIMRGVGALWCALVAVQGALGFVAPLSARAPLGRQAPQSSSPAQPATRLRMVATDFPKFSVSLMDDTRVSFHMDEEHVRKLAAEVRRERGRCTW